MVKINSNRFEEGMTLAKQTQLELTNETKSLSSILRTCKTISKIFSLESKNEWIALELSGYKYNTKGESMNNGPEYRKVHWLFYDAYGSEIPLYPDIAQIASENMLLNPIEEIEKNSEQGLRITSSPIFGMINSRINDGTFQYSGGGKPQVSYALISSNFIDRIISGIKNKMVDFLNEVIYSSEPSIFTEYESIQSSKFPSELKLHAKIISVSETLFQDGHYSQSIFEAVKILEKEIKNKSKIKDKSGVSLVNHVFNKDNPIIKIVEGNESWQVDEREGFRFLFMGTFLGIKNPKSHDNPNLSDSAKALEYLSFLSLLMKRLDESSTDVV